MNQVQITKPQKKSSFDYLFQIYKTKQLQSTLVIIIGAISNIIEGLGITLLIPIFTILMDQQNRGGIAGSNKVVHYFEQFYTFFGFDLNISTALVGFVLIILLSNLILLFQRIFITRFNFQYEYELSCVLYRALFSAKWLTLARIKRGDLITIFTKEINFARTVFLSFLEILSNLVKILTLLIFSCFISFKLTILVVLVGCGMFQLVRYLSKIARQYGNVAKKTRFDLIETLVDVLDNLKFIKLMSLESSNNNRLEEATRNMRESAIKVEWQKHVVFAVNHSIMALIVAIVLFVGTSSFNMQLPQVLVLLLIYARLSPYMVASFSQYNWINSMMISMITVDELKDELLRNIEKTDGLQKTSFDSEIEFRNVTFGYDEKEILRDVNFKIKRGEYVAIVGETGSGKTTILDILLLLAFPSKGEMLIDGVSSRKADLNHWRNKISYVGPENYLLARSIKDNMLIIQNKNPVPSDDTIQEMLDRAALREFILELKDGIHFTLQDKGNNISTGQKQRLNLARAFLRNSEIFIMDEPTSALDFKTEEYIREEINKLKGHKTIIVVTHKKEFAQDADRIIEIHGQNVTEIVNCLV